MHHNTGPMPVRISDGIPGPDYYSGPGINPLAGPPGPVEGLIDAWVHKHILLAPMHDRLWMVWEDYKVEIPYDVQFDLGIYPTHPVHIPKGFVSDLSSSPRILWSIIPPYGPYTGPALLHDYIYRKQYVMGRHKADLLFYEHMLACGTNWVKAYVKYLGVKSGGWRAWNRHSRSQS